MFFQERKEKIFCFTLCESLSLPSINNMKIEQIYTGCLAQGSYYIDFIKDCLANGQFVNSKFIVSH